MLDFLGIGAQKAGTSWIYEALREHPEVRFPGGKEIHFWDTGRPGGIEWYRSVFAESAPNIRQGEMTPAYAKLPPSDIRDIVALNPRLRAFYVIRDPMERAWSAALMALERSGLTIDEVSDQWFIDHFRSRGSLERGDYETCLRNWISVLPTTQLLWLRYEMLCETPLALLEALCRHLGVDATVYSHKPPAVLGRRVQPTLSLGQLEPPLKASVPASPRPAIRDSLLPVLREIYRPRIASLERYLRTDFGAWLAR